MRVATVRLVLVLILIITSSLVIAGHSSLLVFDGFGFNKGGGEMDTFFEGIENGKSCIEEIYTISEESGYILETRLGDCYGYISNYTRGEDALRLTQFPAVEMESTLSGINNVDIEKISYNGKDYIIIKLNDEGESDVILKWLDDGYCFTLDGTVQAEEMMQLAEFLTIE